MSKAAFLLYDDAHIGEKCMILNEMRVLMVSTDRKIFEGGSAVRTRMVEYGTIFAELHIVVFSRKSKTGDLNSTEGEMIAENVRAYPTNSLSKFFCMFDAFRIGKQIFKSKPLSQTPRWVVTSQDPFETGLIAAILSRTFNLSFLVQIHTDFLSPYFPRGGFLNRMRVFVAPFIIAHASHIRVVSERIQRSLMAKYAIAAEKIAVLPVFSSPPAPMTPPLGLREHFSSAEFVLLMVSRLTEEKNIPLALRVFGRVRQRFPQTHLVIVGDGPERRALENLARRLRLEDSIRFEGWQKNTGLYMRKADALLVTSWYEGFGMVLVEAALAGLPVVTSDVGIAGEYVKSGESGLVCPVGDEGCFEAAILRLICEPNERNRFASDFARRLEAGGILDKEGYFREFGLLFDATVRSFSTIGADSDAHPSLAFIAARSSMSHLLRYLVAGLTAAFVNIGSFYILLRFGVWYLTASTLAYLVSFVVSFTFQKFWTFQNYAVSGILFGKQFASYTVIFVSGLSLNALCMTLLVEYALFPKLLSQIFSSGVVAVVSFIGYSAIFSFERRAEVE